MPLKANVGGVTGWKEDCRSRDLTGSHLEDYGYSRQELHDMFHDVDQETNQNSISYNSTRRCSDVPWQTIYVCPEALALGSLASHPFIVIIQDWDVKAWIKLTVFWQSHQKIDALKDVEIYIAKDRYHLNNFLFHKRLKINTKASKVIQRVQDGNRELLNKFSVILQQVQVITTW